MNIRYQIGTINCSIVVSVIFVIKKEITKVDYQLYNVKQKKKITEEDFKKIIIYVTKTLFLIYKVHDC